MVVGVGVEDGGGVSEVGEGGAALRSTEEDGVGSSGGTESELVKSEALSSGGDDASTGGGGESEGADGELRDLKEADIVRDLGYNNSNLAVLLRHVLRKPREGDRGSVNLGLVEPLEDGSAEGRIRPPGKEGVELDQETAVRVGGLHNLHAGLVSYAASSGFKINSHIYLGWEEEGAR
jgi:hypothetical protein